MSPKINELVLWKRPKQTSVIFFSVLIVLWTIASFTLLSLASLLVMLTMLSFGSYRLYYSVMHKIKNTNDLISSEQFRFKVSFPKERILERVQNLEDNLNFFLKELKSLALWVDFPRSTTIFFSALIIYYLGSIFNTISLLILIHVHAFTVPKIYQVYKVQIDQGLSKTVAYIELQTKQMQAKMSKSIKIH